MDRFLRLLRVHQWVKNAFIVFPLIFAGLFRDSDKLVSVTMTLFAFCCVASSVYIFNDLLDLKRDQLHPRKKSRPLSAGTVSIPFAVIIAMILVGVGLFVGFLVNQNVGILFLVYILLHVVYNFYSKNVVILDVFFIAFGFQLRILAGAFAAQVIPSVWLQLCVFVLSLFLGFTKRRAEISSLKDKASEHRMALMEYNLYLLDQIIVIASTLTIVFYGLYTISQEVIDRLHGPYMAYSLGFVIFGIFRYLYLVHVKKLGDEPGEVLLRDLPIVVNGLLWLTYIGILIYFI